MADTKAAKVVLLVKFKSRLSVDEARRRYVERMPRFRELPGLLQKFYFYDEQTKEYGGVYVWDSEESVQTYLESDLRKSIATAYEIEGTPRVERLSVTDILR
jgi:heme-degrading monooxygenase HmoA